MPEGYLDLGGEMRFLIEGAVRPETQGSCPPEYLQSVTAARFTVRDVTLPQNPAGQNDDTFHFTTKYLLIMRFRYLIHSNMSLP